jgi:DNA modification methylase
MRKVQQTIRGGDALRDGLRDKGRKRRHKLSGLGEAGPGRTRNDLLPRLQLVDRKPEELTIPSRNVRQIDSPHVRAVMHQISIAGFLDPPLIDEQNVVWDGVTRAQAAAELRLSSIPCLLASHLSATEKRAVRLALNRLGEKGRWSMDDLKSELIELAEMDIAIEDTAFTLAEFDQITLGEELDAVERGRLTPDANGRPVTQVGDVFLFDDGRHRLICGDATDPDVYRNLMGAELARLVFTDEPYNVPIVGHVTKGDHREFAMASGEMSDQEFLAFNQAWIGAAAANLCDGGLIGTFIDWRGYPKVDAAALALGLTPINLVVWTKTNGGMGSLYRSQHELFPLYKKGNAPHVNNIELGKNGRWRSNVWSYPGASSVSSDSRKGLQLHPTVKPAAMCADAILDLTNRDDAVLDPFLGSGSTLIAAEQTRRRCFGIELDPRYVDVAINRFREVHGRSPVLETTGETFDDLAERRKAEGATA